MRSLLLTTCPGIEDVALAETERLIFFSHYILKPMGIQGRLILTLNEDPSLAAEKLNKFSRTIHRAVILLALFNIRRDSSGLEDIYHNILKLNSLEDYLNSKVTFAVRCERLGKHEYTSIDIARVAGKALQDSFPITRRPKVNLDFPSIIFRVDVIGTSCFIGVCTTGDRSLHRRGYRIYDHPAALKSTLAAALIFLSEVSSNSLVVDPMCGGGTIPIECAFLNPYLKRIIQGFDISPKHIHGAKLNALAAGVHHKISFQVADAKKLDEIVNCNIDRIICNLPYGIRVGRKSFLKKLYSDFLFSTLKVLSSDGKITLLTTQAKLMKNLLGEIGSLKLKCERIVGHGNLNPHIFLLEKA
ncbi:MAG: THUMP domain-containing protein [archaeon GB-1867-097]|nr:THUMP domain-containing protein [Candidatus Culexmicrobium thermophilum]MCS7384206.1 THUMP domain-containing protein [Candidatus Culexmicrobium thermophilum]HDO20347.1 methyltransferase domain-containing protein [Candidatus Bathyarchaeota archaeon]